MEDKMTTISSNDRRILNSIFNPLLPIGEAVDDEDLMCHVNDDDSQSEEALQLELDGVQAAEGGDLVRAEELLTRAVNLENKASGYNNRAQLYRLKGLDEAAMADLEKAINISNGIGKAACQAFCQRGLLFRKYGKDDEAKEDFNRAASLGSSFARRQLVAMNPYAAMCNQMLNEMFVKLNRADCMKN